MKTHWLGGYACPALLTGVGKPHSYRPGKSISLLALLSIKVFHGCCCCKMLGAEHAGNWACQCLQVRGRSSGEIAGECSALAPCMDRPRVLINPYSGSCYMSIVSHPGEVHVQIKETFWREEVLLFTCSGHLVHYKKDTRKCSLWK